MGVRILQDGILQSCRGASRRRCCVWGSSLLHLQDCRSTAGLQRLQGSPEEAPRAGLHKELRGSMVCRIASCRTASHRGCSGSSILHTQDCRGGSFGREAAGSNPARAGLSSLQVSTRRSMMLSPVRRLKASRFRGQAVAGRGHSEVVVGASPTGVFPSYRHRGRRQREGASCRHTLGFECQGHFGRAAKASAG